MASSCALLVDDIDLTGQKIVPDYLSGLFQESDRVETPDEENDRTLVEYRTSGERAGQQRSAERDETRLRHSSRRAVEGRVGRINARL